MNIKRSSIINVFMIDGVQYAAVQTKFMLQLFINGKKLLPAKRITGSGLHAASLILAEILDMSQEQVMSCINK